MGKHIDNPTQSVYTNIADLEFVCDETKRKEVLDSRGIDILDAALVFENPVLVSVDNRRDYGEIRHRAIGVVDGNYYVIVFTVRGSVVRLITCWKASKNDKRKYEALQLIPTSRDEE